MVAQMADLMVVTMVDGTAAMMAASTDGMMVAMMADSLENLPAGYLVQPWVACLVVHLDALTAASRAVL